MPDKTKTAGGAEPLPSSSPRDRPGSSPGVPNGAEAELASILEGIKAADRSALKHLYDRFGARLYGMAHRILRDQALAEDALQEAFVKIWRNAGKFDPERGSATGWVAIIVRRAAFDLRPRDLVLEPSDIPAEQPEMEMLHPGLARALDSLPETHRKALLLMYVYGLTHSELAAAMGAPLGTVKSWVRRGAAALKEALGDG
ncbi:MAG TPA: sigma-70 family RNA polymerase sigma factor [Allosphingosinicella sp.]|nr:sigma-70 family RNA polymerase sigma factor [Allosphingosinicella sp.]